MIATGGPSIPKMGATGFAYDLARQFGLEVVEPRPALVPLTLSDEDALFRDLSGVSAEVVARAGKTAFREAALFTHRGLSGPAILQISSYWRQGEEIGIDFLPDRGGGLGAGRQARAAADPFPHPARRIAAGPAGRGAGEEDRPVGRARQPARRQTARRRAPAAPTGGSGRTAAKASPRPRSRRAGSTPPASPRRRWRRGPCPAFMRSARRSTSPAGWAAIISSGHGLVGGPQRRFFSSTPLPGGPRPPFGL